MTDLKKESEIRWTKPGMFTTMGFMGKDLVVIASGVFIIFVEASRPDRKEALYHANSEVKGDGVTCISTHPNLPCFAFAERCRSPRILVVSYPSFEVVRSFDSVTLSDYRTIRFSEMEYLIAITGIPNFKIVIWNWRTGEKLYTQDTELVHLNQILRVSPTSPVQIIQTTGEDGRLIFWDMNICYKKTNVTRSAIELPSSTTAPYCFTYGADGDIYFVDSNGSLYSINSETHVCTQQYAFPSTDTSGFKPCVTWYKGGIVFQTPTEVLFLRRKSPEGWTKIWSLTPKVPFNVLMASSVKDLLVGVNIRNEVMVFKGEHQVELLVVKSFGADFDFVCFVYPTADYVVTFGNSWKTFNVWSKTTGIRVSQYPWAYDKINALASDPKMPCLIAATAGGAVYVISAYEPHHLAELDRIILTPNSLNEIRFRGQGPQFCVANMDIGEFFLVKFTTKLEVVAYVKVDLKIVDFALPEREIEGASLLIVPMSQLCCRSGQTMLFYSLHEKKKVFQQVKDISLPSIVTEILPSPVSHEELFCVYHRSRKFFLMNLISEKVTQEFLSGHQMKFIKLQTDGEYLYTFGTDGLVIVNPAKEKKCTTLFYAYHRCSKGIKTLALDSCEGYVITLGETGGLVCALLKKLQRPGRKAEMEALMSSPAYKQFFLQTPKTKPTDKPETVKETKTNWLALRNQEIVNFEEQHNRKEKQSILEEFNSIKAKVCELLDENMANEPEKQLPINAFDLDKFARRKKLEDAKADREKEKQFRLARMKCLTKLTDIIKTNCWDSVAVKGREIQGIISPVAVQSYALLPESKTFNHKLTWLTESKKIIDMFATGDFFDPWIPRTDSELEELINYEFKVSGLEVVQTIKTKYEEEQMEDEKAETETAETEEKKSIWSGTSTHNFIEVDPKHYNQFELNTFLQSHQEIYFIETDIKKLMLWFNKEFSETFSLKEKEMAVVTEKNNRLRHIIKELSFFNFSPRICKTQIYDPEWASAENPEMILKVLDEEITVEKYVSDSEMNLLKKKQAEEERLRQLLMADDFKERALMVMMDGVLEKLWEEEIKKDPPKPKCMTEKDPSAYTEDDLKAIRAYEESVKFLASERERYRKLLEAEWAKSILFLKDSVSKFDEKVIKLHLLKLKVEAAIGQELLKILRIRKRCFDWIVQNRRKEALKLEISKTEKRIEILMWDYTKLVDSLNECRNVHEGLLNKDKNLDKNFKREFPEYSPMICEQLYKLSKKRPKLIQKAAMYSTVLNDLGKCAISGMKPEYMPAECIQYLKDIDALDPYSNAPASVSQQTWEHACKLRRLKIDAELKIRACAIELADAEATVAACQKALKSAKEQQNHLQNELSAVRAEELQDYMNYPIQLVLKKGLIEIPLTGQISDFDECVFVTKETLGQVNKEIQKIGQNKLKAMQKAANFRKGIIYKEWEHKKLRMEIEDLKGQLQTIEQSQVLKELQAILTGRARGFTEEKGFLYSENELARVKEKFKKAQTEIFEKMDLLDQKIERMNAKNHELDLKITELHAEVNEMNLGRDADLEKKQFDENMKVMKKIREKGKLVRKIQEQHNEILLLQTELELLRLRTYPTIKYKIS